MSDRLTTSDETHDGVARPEAAGTDTAPPKPPFYKRHPILLAVIAVAVIAAGVGGLLYWLHARHFVSTDDAFIDGHVVQINPKVAGYVVTLTVADNELVHKGDLLVEVDPRDFRAALAQAEAGRASAEAKLRQAEALKGLAQAGVTSARANVAAAEATARNAEQELNRIVPLVPSGAATPQERDQAVANAKSSAAAVEANKAKLAQAEAEDRVADTQITVARAAVQQAAAQVEQSGLTLGYARIVAPVTGRVTHRTVERGDYVQAGQALFALVEPDVWVTANFKETELTDIQPGQPVTVTVDAYPHREFTAHVDSLQRGTGARFSLLPPENATGNYVKVVQRVPVKIVFDQPPDPGLMLGPGMSVVPKVRVR